MRFASSYPRLDILFVYLILFASFEQNSKIGRSSIWEIPSRS